MNKPGTELLSIGEAAAALGVAVATLRRWHRHGRLLPALRTLAKDRLLRFGSELLFQICPFFGVEVVVLDAAAGISREQQLTEDLVEILTVFSSRLYGSRSRKNQKALAG